MDQQNETSTNKPMPTVEVQTQQPLTPEQLTEQSILQTKQEIINRLKYAQQFDSDKLIPNTVMTTIISGENPVDINNKKLLELNLISNGMWVDEELGPIDYNIAQEQASRTISRNILEKYAEITDPDYQKILKQERELNLLRSRQDRYINENRSKLLDKFNNELQRKLQEIKNGKGIIVASDESSS